MLWLHIALGVSIMLNIVLGIFLRIALNSNKYLSNETRLFRMLGGR